VNVVYTRTCLRYFLPPQWLMDKDSVSALSFEELASFPLEDFFDHYERGLKKVCLVSTHYVSCLLSCRVYICMFGVFVHRAYDEIFQF